MKLLLIAAVVTLGLSSAAFAQSVPTTVRCADGGERLLESGRRNALAYIDAMISASRRVGLTTPLTFQTVPCSFLGTPHWPWPLVWFADTPITVYVSELLLSLEAGTVALYAQSLVCDIRISTIPASHPLHATGASPSDIHQRCLIDAQHGMAREFYEMRWRARTFSAEAAYRDAMGQTLYPP
jgi:hypothetical protein